MTEATVTHEITSQSSTLEFRFWAKVEDVPVRPCSFGKAEYQPVTLRFKLHSQGRYGQSPSYNDLAAENVSIFGYKIKKDGTPGKTENIEHLYSFSERPDWASKIIREELDRLRGDHGCPPS